MGLSHCRVGSTRRQRKLALSSIFNHLRTAAEDPVTAQETIGEGVARRYTEDQNYDHNHYNGPYLKAFIFFGKNSFTF